VPVEKDVSLSVVSVVDANTGSVVVVASVFSLWSPPDTLYLKSLDEACLISIEYLVETTKTVPTTKSTPRIRHGTFDVPRHDVWQDALALVSSTFDCRVIPPVGRILMMMLEELECREKGVFADSSV
jgi:hypothetical protein